MSIKYNGHDYHFRQSVIDPSGWPIIPGDPPKHASSIASEGAGSSVLGWAIVYVDDFASVADDAMPEVAKQAIEKKWQIWTSRRGTDQADTNLSNNPEDYTDRLRDIAMVSVQELLMDCYYLNTIPAAVSHK